MAVTVRRREAIWQNVQATLDSIPEIDLVERLIRHYDDPRVNFPYVGWAPTPSERVELLATNLAHHVSECLLVVYVREEVSTDSEDANAELSYLMDAITTALMADPTRGGYAFATKPVEWRTNEGVVFDERPVRAAQLRFEIHWERSNTVAT